MKLNHVLRQLSSEELNLLARKLDLVESEHDSTAHTISRLEQTIKSPRHVDIAISLRRPPVLAILLILLESPEYSFDQSGFRDKVRAKDQELTELVSSGQILGSENNHLYRRVLTEAWRNDLRLDASEVSVLGVLRHELGMSQVDHYLTAQHKDVSPYWKTEDPYETVFQALVNNGILFAQDQKVYLPEDLVRFVRETLGLYLAAEGLGRLLGYISNDNLYESLKDAGLKSSGTKDERIGRLIENMISPYQTLSTLSLAELQALAEDDIGCKKTGNKDEIIHRIISYVSEDKDLIEEAEKEEIEIEQKELTQEDFEFLFTNLSGPELTFILIKISSSRQTGSKASKINALWSSPCSERTLLGYLNVSGLKDLSQELGVASTGNKTELMDRLLREVTDRHREK